MTNLAKSAILAGILHNKNANGVMGGIDNKILETSLFELTGNASLHSSITNDLLPEEELTDFLY